ncbi:MAG: hypothetical protein ACK53A_06255 [Gemmatimonadota bacterium]
MPVIRACTLAAFSPTVGHALDAAIVTYGKPRPGRPTDNSYIESFNVAVERRRSAKRGGVRYNGW